MKIIKALAFITVLFFATNIQAQSFEKWPAMQSVNDVITRIDSNTDNIPSSISYFSETLKQFSDELTSKPIPAEYKSKKIQKAVKNLQNAANNLNEQVLSNAPNATLLTYFAAVKTKFAEFKATL